MIIDTVLLILIIAPILHGFLKFVDGLFYITAPILLISLIILYFWSFTRLFKRSIGQFFLGYKIIASTTGTPFYLKRVMFGQIAWILTGFTIVECLTDFDNTYWWDRKSNTRAVPART